MPAHLSQHQHFSPLALPLWYHSQEIIKVGEPKKSGDERHFLALLKINASFFCSLPQRKELLLRDGVNVRIIQQTNSAANSTPITRGRLPVRGGPGNIKYWFSSCFPTFLRWSLDHCSAKNTWSIPSKQFTAELQAVVIFIAVLYFFCFLHRSFTLIKPHCTVKQHTP